MAPAAAAESNRVEGSPCKMTIGASARMARMEADIFRNPWAVQVPFGYGLTAAPLALCN